MRSLALYLHLVHLELLTTKGANHGSKLCLHIRPPNS